MTDHSTVERDPESLDPSYDVVDFLNDHGWHTVPGIVTCSFCGAAVSDTAAHTAWHQRAERRSTP